MVDAHASKALPDVREEQSTELLLKTLADAVPLQDARDAAARRSVLEELGDICQRWSVAMCARQNHRLPLEAAASLHISGSECLGLNERGQDIDVVVVVPRAVGLRHFFDSLQPILQASPRVSGLRPLEGAYVPLLTFDMAPADPTGGPGAPGPVNVDLMLATLDVDRLSPYLDLHVEGAIALAADEKSKLALNGPRATHAILRHLPAESSRAVFLAFLRAVRLWARRRGLYSNKLGYLGGVNVCILAAKVLQMYPTAPLPTLVERFFAIYKDWDWGVPVSLVDGPLLPCDAAMTILTPALPPSNSAPVVSQGTLKVMQAEMQLAHQQVTTILQSPWPCDDKWEALFTLSDFVVSRERFLSIDVTIRSEGNPLWFSATPGLREALLHTWTGFVESRLRKLVDLLGPALKARRMRLLATKLAIGGGFRWLIGFDTLPGTDIMRSVRVRSVIQRFEEKLRQDAHEKGVWEACASTCLSALIGTHKGLHKDWLEDRRRQVEGTLLSPMCLLGVEDVAPCDVLPDDTLEHFGGRAAAAARWEEYRSAWHQAMLAPQMGLQKQLRALRPANVPRAASPPTANKSSQLEAHAAARAARRRPLAILDGMNVARAVSFDARPPRPRSTVDSSVLPPGSARAIAIAADHLLARGFDVDIVLPEWAWHGGGKCELDECQLLDPYLANKQLHLSSRGHDDDEFILESALQKGASMVLTNDLYRNHRRDGTVDQCWLTENCVGYVFVGHDLFIQPRSSTRELPPAAPCEKVEPVPPQQPRPIIIDGRDVSLHSWFLRASSVSCENPNGYAQPLVNTIEYFKARGHAIHCLLPQWAYHGYVPQGDADSPETRRPKPPMSERELLKPYLRKNVHLTPSGFDCDRFLVQVAQHMGALLLSNDNFNAQGAVGCGWLCMHQLRFRLIFGQELQVFGPCSDHGPVPRPAKKRSIDRAMDDSRKKIKPEWKIPYLPR